MLKCRFENIIVVIKIKYLKKYFNEYLIMLLKYILNSLYCTFIDAFAF